MRVLNDYECNKCLESTEEFVDPIEKTILCSCGGVKHQVLHGGGSYFKINGARMDINSEQWAKKREKNGRKRDGY